MHDDLPNQPDEVAQLASDLDARLLQGVVIEKDIMGAVRERKTYDGVWISSHANNEGVLLSNGFLDVPALAQYLSAVRARWVVFNSCEGYEFVDKLQQFYPLDVVAASVKGLKDISAWRTAALIARHLGKSHNLREALRLASPGGAAPFRFWPSPGGVETEVNQEEKEDMQVTEALRQEIRTVRDEMLKLAQEGRDDIHQMEVEITKLAGRVQGIESMYAKVQHEPSFAQRDLRLIMVGIYLIVILLMVFIVWGRGGFA
jgi:hypothetical protein